LWVNDCKLYHLKKEKIGVAVTKIVLKLIDYVKLILIKSKLKLK